MAKKVEVESAARRAKGSRPPRIDLGVGVELITAVYERAGGISTFDELSEIMQNSRSSSGFQQKLTALRMFNLVETESERVSLSPTAERIVAPESPELRSAALKEAFLTVEPFANAYAKYVGKILPQDEFLKNSFLEFGRDLAEPWMRKFKASILAAGLLMDRGDGKFQVRESGKTLSKPTAAKTENHENEDRAADVLFVAPPAKTVSTVKTEYQMLIEILDAAQMTDTEQAAVWTLIQYLKKRDAGVTDKTPRTEIAELEKDE